MSRATPRWLSLVLAIAFVFQYPMQAFPAAIEAVTEQKHTSLDPYATMYDAAALFMEQFAQSALAGTATQQSSVDAEYHADEFAAAPETGFGYEATASAIDAVARGLLTVPAVSVDAIITLVQQGRVMELENLAENSVLPDESLLLALSLRDELYTDRYIIKYCVDSPAYLPPKSPRVLCTYTIPQNG